MRVVLYAEGPGERASLGRLPPTPNTPLDSSHWGPAHLLIERALREHVGIDAIEFAAPLRDPRGRRVAGSLLLDQPTLRRLLTWPARAPDLAAVLIDGDGDTNERRRRLLSACAARRMAHPPVVVIVCSPEFEAWLLADSKAIEAALGCAGGVPQPETLGPREAKAHWNRLCGGGDEAAIRRQVIQGLSLDRLKTSCRSFEQALQDLAEACRSLKPS